jgi:hypothetical protein
MLKELEDIPGLKTAHGLALTPVGRAAWFTDSEGHILNVFQRLQPCPVRCLRPSPGR